MPPRQSFAVLMAIPSFSMVSPVIKFGPPPVALPKTSTRRPAGAVSRAKPPEIPAGQVFTFNCLLC